MTTYVPVSVPEHLLLDVYALLQRDLRPAMPPSQAQAVPVRGQGSWTEQELAELSRRLTHPGGRAVLDAIANAGVHGSDVTYEDLQKAGAAAMESGEFTFDQLRAQLSWASRFSREIRGGVKQWPIELSDRGQACEKGKRYVYAMPKLVAEWWLTHGAGR